jgi:hypothetical protein
MLYFNFDLVIDDNFKSQGGMILEDTGMPRKEKPPEGG